MLFAKEKFVLVDRVCKVKQSFLVRITDGADPETAIRDASIDHEYLDGCDEVIESDDDVYTKTKLGDNWRDDLKILQRAKHIMSNYGEEEPEPPKKKRGRPRKKSLTNEPESDTITGSQIATLAKGLENVPD